MVPPSIDWEAYREQITGWVNEGVNQSDIISRLETATAQTIHRRTLARRLASWGVRKNNPPQDTTVLNARIAYMFHVLRLPDAQAVRILRHDGFEISQRTLQRRRLDIGLYKHLDKSKHTIAEDLIRDVLKHELDQGHIEGFGRRNLYSYLRSKYNIVGRDRVFNVASGLNPQAFEQRPPRAPAHQVSPIVPGPNYSWSVDAYSKLQQWGIQIYAAIDAYSRHIIWIYAGTSGRSAVSVLAQYLATVRNCQVIPTMIQSSKGAETALLADAHYQISQELRPRDEGEPLQFEDCYKLGVNQKNQHIEGWWGKLTVATINRWRETFQRLEDSGDYHSSSLADRIAFLAIYIPIIRQETLSFVELWNTHTIRKQKNRPHCVPGIPHLLYHYPQESGGEQCGMFVDPANDRLARLEEGIQGFEVDEYLPKETSEWCTQVLRECGYQDTIDGGQSNEDGIRLHSLAYISLRDAARVHVAERRLPFLSESPVLDAGGLWESNHPIDPQIRQAFSGDTEATGGPIIDFG